MRHVLKVMQDLGLRCLPCEPVNLDVERFIEYRDSEEHPTAQPFEYPPARHKVCVPAFDGRIPPLLHYFLDGSRRTYRIGDIILTNRRYLPLVAAQVGVAVVERGDDGRHIRPLRDLCKFRNVIAFPENILDDDLAELKCSFMDFGLPSFEFLRYNVKPDRDPVDLAVARIMSAMHDIEVEAVKRMTDQHLLDHQSLLVIDGPLRFKKTGSRQFDIVQFRNVIGLSKTFRPSFSIGGTGRARQDVGSITHALDAGERTPVFKSAGEDEKTLGVWYLRLRHRERMGNPLQGVVKIECYAIEPEELESGLDGDRINTISGHVLRERNVTPYQADLRWASHIYPIYLAETYLKSSFMSDLRFRALF